MNPIPTIQHRAAILVAATIMAAMVPSQASDTVVEPALAITADSPQLQWGPCPPFLPKGCGLSVLHGDPAKPNVDVFLRLPPHSRLPPHIHTSAERMILVAGELQVTYRGQKMATLKPGSYAYGPAKRPHDGACVSDHPCILFIAFEGPLDATPLVEAAH